MAFQPVGYQLNEYQLEALKRRLSADAKRVGGVRGPPGTGKTSTLIPEVVNAVTELGESVLVCAGQNATVDQTLLGIHTQLSERGWLNAVRRTGNVSKSSDFIVRNFYAATYDEARRARVVVTTFHSAVVSTGNMVLDPNDPFDRLVFDETGQATPEQAWIPLILLDQQPKTKVSVYGDDKQLMPFSPDWIKEKGILGHLAEKNPDAVLQLDTSYRLNDGNVDMTSSIWYGGTLNSPPEVRARRLSLSGSPTGPYRRVIDAENTLVFVGVNTPEEDVRQSYRNIGQAHVVRDLVREMLDLGVEPRRIDCMAIYRPQVEAINALLAGTGVSCSTVHKKLGAENDVSIECATRANSSRTMGIASYAELWNVATSRARLKNIIVGDSGDTFSEGTSITRRMHDFVERRGVIEHIVA